MAPAADRKVRIGQTDDRGSRLRVGGISCRRAASAPRIHFMEAILTSIAVVAIAEIGDKTQLPTSLLAAQFHNITLVTIGTTVGMMLANVPAVLLGEVVTKIIPLKYVRTAAAFIFAAIGLWIVLAGVVTAGAA